MKLRIHLLDIYLLNTHIMGFLLLITQFFYGLTPMCQTLVDTTIDGYPGEKNAEEFQEIYENLLRNS